MIRVRTQTGATIIMVAVISVVAALIIMATIGGLRLSASKSGSRRVGASLINICEAAKEDALMRLRAGRVALTASTRAQLIGSTQFSGGTYVVTCSSNADTSSGWLWATGSLGGQSKTIEVNLSLVWPVLNLGELKGAITARTNVEVSGNANVDGRDYDSTGSGLTDTMGMGGVWSCGTVVVTGSAGLGGNGVAPLKKGAAPGSYTENADCSDYVETPEEMLGVPPGGLDIYKMTGAEFAALSFPVHGIFYVTSDCGPIQCGASSGVLIVHNETTTASLHINGGTFKGIVIADLLNKANGTVDLFGAVYLLSKTGTVGNGDATIGYSSLILENIETYCGGLPPFITEVGWREL